MKTKAVVFTEAGKAEIKELNMEDPGPDEVQIQTEWSYISTGTERWCLLNQFTWSPTPYPCVPGYQRVGRVVKVGKSVSKVKLGDRVMATTGSWSEGPTPFWGAHIQTANTVESEVYCIADHVSSINAAAAVVAQVGSNAAARITLTKDDWVVIFGEGLIGQSAAQGARAFGARTILVGRHEERLALAKLHSADHAILNRGISVVDEILQITGGTPVAAVIDTIQVESVQREYMPIFRKYPYGQIVYAGYTPSKVWADMALLQQSEMTCHFVTAWTRARMEQTLYWMSEDKIRMDSLVTHSTSYKDAPAIYEMIVQNKEPFMGICINWEEA